jgi:hypothetical protein
MVAMKGMLVAVVDVVHMVIMMDRFVPTARSVPVVSQANLTRMRAACCHGPCCNCPARRVSAPQVVNANHSHLG